MSRPFPLAGLLRLRQLQEDRAAAALAIANREAALHSARVAAVRRDLRGTAGAEITDATSLRAVAAARASGRSMLASLEALSGNSREAADEALEAFTQARVQSAGLEKLQNRHNESEAVDELRIDQAALDELALMAQSALLKGV